VTIGHFVALVLLFSTIGNNIVVTISREGGSQSLAVAQTTAALIVGVFCFAVDIISGIVMGHSLFHPVVCSCLLLSHMNGLCIVLSLSDLIFSTLCTDEHDSDLFSLHWRHLLVLHHHTILGILRTLARGHYVQLSTPFI
jgi:hypothetical protein